MKYDFGSVERAPFTRRKVLMGLAFGSAAAFAAWRIPRTRVDYLGRDKLEDIVPNRLGKWEFAANSGLVIPPDDQLSKALYSQLLTRVYFNGTDSPIMLLVAQSAGQTGVLQIHRPEVCYPASGFDLSPVSTFPVTVAGRTLTTVSLAATFQGETEHILYWTRVGNKLPVSWKDQRMAVAEQNLQGIVPDAILIRVSTRNADPVAARASLASFIGSLMESVPASKRKVFVV